MSYACSQLYSGSSLKDAMEGEHNICIINIHAKISACLLSESASVNPEQCRKLKLNKLIN